MPKSCLVLYILLIKIIPRYHAAHAASGPLSSIESKVCTVSSPGVSVKPCLTFADFPLIVYDVSSTRSKPSVCPVKPCLFVAVPFQQRDLLDTAPVGTLPTTGADLLIADVVDLGVLRELCSPEHSAQICCNCSIALWKGLLYLLRLSDWY